MEFGEFRSPCAPILTKKYSVLKEEENEIFDNIFSCTAKYFSTPPPKKKKKVLFQNWQFLGQLVQQTSIRQIQGAHSINYGQNLGAVTGCTFALFFKI